MARQPVARRIPRRLFLLSPAHCNGERARLLRREAAAFDLALRVRGDGAPVGEVFSFLSGLYFRGKLAYARAFATSGVFVITPCDGLVDIEQPLRLDDLARYAAVDVDAAEARYRVPLVRDCARLAERLASNCEVVLLGSVATGKYLTVLEPVFGARLRVPREFIGRGDMSRGALLLRAMRAERELDYVPVDALPTRTRRTPRSI